MAAQMGPIRALEIHHVNVEHGDATIIAVRDETTRPIYQYKLLIDASTTKGQNMLAEYFASNFEDTEFDHVIASHYHDDHIRGFADGLGVTFHSRSITDVGGYDLTAVQSILSPSDAGVAVPSVNPATYPANPPNIPVSEVFNDYQKAIKFSARDAEPQKLQRLPLPLPSPVGHPITLFNLGVNITLTCIAGNGYVFGGAQRDVGGGQDPNPNNYGLAFILQYGAFRYYTGGDLGGSGAPYVNHEASLAGVIGHVCAFKSNHHGSDNSNNAAFLAAMTPAVCVTSVGRAARYRLPGGNFLNRLNATNTVHGQQGFFFTNLADYGPDNARRTQAQGLFGQRANTCFRPGSATYVIRVPFHANIVAQSIFQVYEDGAPIATFNCH